MNKPGSSVIGTNVKSTSDQKSVGKVQALVIDQKEHKVSGLLIKDDPLFSSQVIPIENVKNIAEEVEIETPDHIKRANDIFDEPKNDTQETGKFVESTKVKSMDGQEMGTVKDFKFNPDTGQIEEYIVKTIDEKEVIIKRSDVKALDQTSITIDKQLVEQPPPEPPKPEQKKQGAKEGIKGMFDSVTQGLTKLTENKKDEELVGKYVTKNILTKEDSVFVKRGDMITHTLMQKAKEQGVFDQLKQNTSSSLEATQ